MQLVINVDEKDVEFVKENFKPTGYSSIPLSIQTEFISAVLNGVPDSFMNKPETVTEFADRCRECGKQKTGHWILTDVEYNRVYHCKCSECGKYPMDYIRGSENWWFIKNRLPKCCPNCGVKMVNPQKNDCDIKARAILSKLCEK